MKQLAFFVLPAGLIAAAPAHAQVEKPLEGVTLTWCEEESENGECLSPASVGAYRDMADDRITVLANGFWSKLDEQAQAISVLDMHDLQQVQGPDITRALQRLPGVTFARNGGPGSFTGVSVRGSASERVLVVVDGVRMSDLASPAGGFDFGSVVTGSIERLELLRGSNALVWGSDAMGGVINLSTRLPDGIDANAEYGGDGQLAASFALGLRHQGGDAGISASYVKRDGFSAAAAGTEDDGFEQLALGFRGNAQLSGYFTAFASARYTSGESEIDGFPGPAFTLADTLERQEMRQLSARAGVEFANGIDRQALLSVSHSRTQRDMVDAAVSSLPNFSTDGRSTRVEARGWAEVADDLGIFAGGDWQQASFSDGSAGADRDSGGIYAMLAWAPEYGLPQLGNDARVNLGIRRDHDEGFGGAWNFAANGMVQLSDPIGIRLSYGEGFKAPSLFQLHSDFGNLALEAERSRSFDLGVDYTGTGASASLTLFRRDSRDLIDFVSCFGVIGGICTGRPYGTYDNIGRARSQGVEVELNVNLAAGLNARTAYAFTSSTNRETGLRLARRPRHAGTFSLDWTPAIDALTFGADLRLVSASFDDAANLARLQGYALLDLRAEWAVTDQISLFGRIENVWDEGYQTASGYGTQGRAAYIGVRGAL